ncbi:hypothetical protein NMW39_22245 [Escherichia coli]|uniref:hypothetical protein n=1 Tax=Escherichia coli TaxID=562 RepID=UPI00185622BC|nr:hypothetical protein [Escherichia coli]EAT0220323.1 hypothetical protein [Salmonella enterica]EDX6306885.1 hypothetical protein [Salmonella enterica subsp. enterica serovar Java]EAT6264553.1 hypothetical protein [Salmonella enterica]EEV1955481.1 hypothetical protein [Escherichia coli]EFO8644982.1 hypothetical protein [Salmonella enterica]
MSDNIDKPKKTVELEDIKREVFYFLVFVCVFFMSITSFTSSSDSVSIQVLRCISFFVLIYLIASYGSRLIESVLIYVEDNHYKGVKDEK